MVTRDPSQHTFTPLKSGTVVGHYEILALLGRGGMGVVYRARDQELPRDIALKSPRPEVANSTVYRRRFLREARAVAQLSSPFIVPIFEIFEEGGVPWLAMELVEGRSLRDLINEGGPLPTLDTLRYARHLAEALKAAHVKRILHRDVKPSNIMVSPEDRVRLMDFGLARIFISKEDIHSGLTPSESITNGLLGTPQYMSPEQALGRPLDGRSDIFALGAVLYEMCTGKPAFSGSTKGDVRDAILNREPTAISRLNYEVPEELERIVRKAMAKSPDERYPNVSDLLVDLQVIRRQYEHQDYQRSHPETGPPASKLRTHGRRSSIIRAVLLLIVVGAVALSAWWLSSQLQSAPDQTHRLAPVATWPTREFDARISQDQEWVSFISNRGGACNIWLRKVTGGEAARVTSEQDNVISHLWSPDGNEIAYVIRKEGGTLFQIIPAPLGGRARLRIEFDNLGLPGTRLVRWIGSHIYIEHNGILFCLDTDTTSLDRLTREHSISARDFDVRSDGKKVVYSGYSEGEADLWISDLDGKNRQRITSDEYPPYSPRWAGAEDDRVFFVSNRTGQMGIWQLDLADGSVQSIPAAEAVIALGDISADASLLTMSTVVESSNLCRLDRETQSEHLLTGDRMKDIGPCVSAGSNRVAFQRQQPARSFLESKIFTATWSANGLDEERMEVSEGFGPSISADGLWLAYLRVNAGEAIAIELWVKDLRNQRTRCIADRIQPQGYCEFPAGLGSLDVVWSRRRPELFFTAVTDQGSRHIVRCRVDVETAQPEDISELTAQGQRIFDLCLSRDEERLAYVLHPGPESREAQVHQLNLLSLEDRVLFTRQLTARMPLHLAGWLADDQSLLGLSSTQNDDFTQDMELLEIAPGEARIVDIVRQCYWSTARLESEQGLLYLTRADGPVHNLYAFSLVDKTWHCLTNNVLPQVTYSGINGIGGDLLYARQEEGGDIWMIRIGTEPS